MTFAGFWENWKTPEGEWLRTFAIITTEANDLCRTIHDRMPVILAPEDYARWLGEDAADPDALKALLRPYPADRMHVGMTRARDRLFLSRAERRPWRGGSRMLSASPFLTDIEAQLVEHSRATAKHKAADQLKLL